ncbi:hypothetical protein [Lysobacter gummosus]|uniref:hypothetical protein n=1 Tax=Lysobacter gummosus TaxID=262324 RepID=UPI00363C74BE
MKAWRFVSTPFAPNSFTCRHGLVSGALADSCHCAAPEPLHNHKRPRRKSL